ncbi:hypothetical protein [Planosporangium mesophilum]|uniref:Uncharacterized protein n=1 Tax=Planosporangium mesophilum TaxID=689768 RepID=A0A8J3WYY7_9ACTN|nr:hypothetical protein [Planosporangium mesophilum]NJC81680.1 hypothetical protein [Planosporangium mesophilum]GII20659.1 hypothetical protein Pme01_02560 [Planosporangium mesophilum]
MLSTLEAAPVTGVNGRGIAARRPTLIHWTPPFLVHLASNVLFWYAAHRHGFDWLKAATHARYDAFQYLSIARNGYRAEHCPPEMSVPGLTEACGNIGWFPLYPLVLRPVHDLFGLDWAVAGVVVAEVCLLGVLLLLWHLLGARATARNVACLALAACWPGAIYYHATFPIALSVLLALVTWTLLSRGWWALAGLAGMLTAMTYSISALIAPAMLAYLFLTRSRGSWTWLRQAVVACGLTSLGVAATFALLWHDTGRPMVFMDYHRRWGGGLHNPVTSYRELLHALPVPGTGPHAWPVPKVITTLGWELHAALALVVVAVLVVAVEAARGRANALDVALTLYGFLIFTVPLIVGPHITQSRSHALMLPVVLVLRRLPAVGSGLFALAAVPLAYALGVLFLVSTLV